MGVNFLTRVNVFLTRVNLLTHFNALINTII